ncbi:MAG: hypothetical protein F6K07_32025 [Okeania sp. SIO1H5]|uniref:hypothetical protein n=1 Tax=Okeania sp. SIO1H5 TaxID=2607777 RepID=UPI0013BE5459|nr:hypothetical protein [Okeania sp. SIO1H5]NET23636.1 hypothetical protein [Okeania sp. SIO1H5]
MISPTPEAAPQKVKPSKSRQISAPQTPPGEHLDLSESSFPPEGEVKEFLVRIGRTFGRQVFAPGICSGSSEPDPENEIPEISDKKQAEFFEKMEAIWMNGQEAEIGFVSVLRNQSFGQTQILADFLTLFPKSKTEWFILFHSSQREQLVAELRRPLFAAMKRPLAQRCRLLEWNRLADEIAAVHSHLKYLKVDFIRDLSFFADMSP